MPEIQTVLIPRARFTRPEAHRWIMDHGYKTIFKRKKVHVTKQYYRFRQNEPSDIHAYYTVSLRNGIKLVFQE